jgi:VIT1/CCC1 family predicted Fe2+/Mn2+ transporter
MPNEETSMADDPVTSSKRVLEPIERISEVLFGLIMVLTFTGSLSVAEAGRDDVRIMLIGALGCNVAWGIIDGVLYLMGSMAEKGRALQALQALRRASSAVDAQRIIGNALPPLITSVLQPSELDAIRQRLVALPEPEGPARPSARDLWGTAGVFLLVFLSTFPVTVPFFFIPDAGRALRVSNAIAIAMLFATGYAFGRAAGRSPWLVGLAMVLLGSILVGLTIALGG